MESRPAIVRSNEIKRTRYNNEWWYVVEDVILALTGSKNPRQYIRYMKQRDPELVKGWVQIVRHLSIETADGFNKMPCANIEGIFRIIQSIPAPMPEPYKQWLAKVGYERILEFEDPESTSQHQGDKKRTHGLKNASGPTSNFEIILSMLEEAAVAELAGNKDTREVCEDYIALKKGIHIANEARGNLEAENKDIITMPMYYAHSIESENKNDWQPLEEHLRNVADLSYAFSSVFGAGNWGKVSGFAHDAGKASNTFQRRLCGESVRVDHSTFGARLAGKKCGPLGMLIAYAVAGHHGGIPDGGTQEGQLHYRLKHGNVPDDVEQLPGVFFKNELPLPFKLTRDRGGFSLSFFTRMIFSCLVDADFLDTESFCDPEKASFRPEPNSCSLFPDIKHMFDNHLAEKVRSSAPTPVNKMRQRVLAQCREKAAIPPGFFSLTVPTGGGKTFSSMAFSLEHLLHFDMRRIIYAIPFTSIIEQNAEVFREMLGRDHVLEHHCNYKESDEPEDRAYNRMRNISTENWDAPVVVTTNVQFFESLFSNKPSRCRKLHNIAKSVIVLDEAQAIPTEYLEPCLAALRELVDHYGCTVLLCTATQPALDDSSSLRMALPYITEIIDDTSLLFQELSRTAIEFIGTISDDALAERLKSESQVLCILSTKPHTKAVFERNRETDGFFHLSTNMYPQHRRRVLDEIRTRLKEGKTCRVISTSLVEAGVDLDFPVVYRAMAGLDSIAQAAGRCNREGKMKRKGKVFIFNTEKLPSMPWLKLCASRAAETIRTLTDDDAISLKAMRKYFELIYNGQNMDKKGVVKRLNTMTRNLYFPFRSVAIDFRFIEDESIGIIIPDDPEVEVLIQELRHTEFPRATIRKLQQYSIGTRRREFAALDSSGSLEIIRNEFPVLRNMSAYRKDVGLCVSDSEIWDIDELIF